MSEDSSREGSEVVESLANKRTYPAWTYLERGFPVLSAGPTPHTPLRPGISPLLGRSIS